MTTDKRLLTDAEWERQITILGWDNASQRGADRARDHLCADRAARIEQIERLRGLLRRAHPLLSHKRTCALVMRRERVRRAVENGWPVDDAMYHCNCDFNDLASDIDAALAAAGKERA